MTKGINRLARSSEFSPCSPREAPRPSAGVRVPSGLQFAQPPLLDRADTFSIFVRSCGDRGTARALTRFSRFSTRLSRVVFPKFLSCLRCFFAVRRILFCRPALFFFAIPRKQPVVDAGMANRSRFRVTNALSPPLFRDRSFPLRWAVVKFDRKQRFTWTTARGRRFFSPITLTMPLVKTALFPLLGLVRTK